MKTDEIITSFGYWVRRRRKALDLTQAELAQHVGCALVTLKKIEWDERRPSHQMAERLADYLAIPAAERDQFLRMARGEFVIASISPSVVIETRVFKHNLPLQPTPFIGREKELADITRRLKDPACRLLTLVGPGGIGKTRLALQAAQTLLHTPFAEATFRHGILFVPLTAISSPSGIVSAIAEAANFTFYSNVPPKQQLLDYLREKEMLLMLDNFEHLLAPPLSSLRVETEGHPQGGEELVVELLQAALGLKILVTSRAGLNVQWEQRFPLDGIDFPNSEEEIRQEITRYSAIQLFLQAARRVRPDFELASDEAPAVAQICRLMQGMPLGILLAAAWIDLLKLAEIAAQIGQSLDFLTSDWRDLPERQQSLRAVFDHSWGLLTEQEQAVFQQISVFRGGFTYETAQAVTGASLQELRALVNKSLLRRIGTGRYEIHELLRQYGAEKLAQTPTAEAALRDRHSAYYCTFLQVREADLKGERQQLALADIQADHENIRLAWRWAAEQGQVERLAQAMDGLGFFYDWRGRFQEGEAACQVAAEKLATPISADKLLVLTKILTWQALFCLRLGYIEPASQLFEESLICLNSRELADRDTLSEKAFVLLEMGKYMAYTAHQEAEHLLEQSLTLYRRLEDRWATACALDALGNIAWWLSSYEEAKQRFQESLAIRQELGDQRGIAEALNMLGNVTRHQGQLEECEQLQRESLVLFEKMGDQANIAQVYLDLGTALFWLGRFSEAISPLEEGLAIYSNLGHRTNLAWANDQLSDAKLHLGWYEQVRAHMQTALTLFRETGDQRGLSFSLQTQACIALIEEAYTEAQQSLQEGVVILRRIRHPVALGFSLATLGGVASNTNNFQQAQQYLLEPLRIALETRAFFLLHVTLAFVALFLANWGQPEWAVEIYTLASRFPYVGNSRWFEDVVGRRVAAAAALPPEVVAAAQERSRERDAWATAVELLAELESGEMRRKDGR